MVESIYMDQVVNTGEQYKLLDAGEREKLEQWGNFVLRRPDPQAIWPRNPSANWDNWDMYYHRNDEGGGSWESKGEAPDEWSFNYKDLKFAVKPMGFKHTGVFPEQAGNWDFIAEKLASRPKAKVLNLFGYTGLASVVAVHAGAEVTHVDSAKEIMDMFSQNLEINGLRDEPVRLIVDDVIKFVKREITRGNKYDAIIMDPPSFGRGASGQVWKIEQDLPKLLELCSEILSDNPLFVVMSAYATDILPQTFQNLVSLNFKAKQLASGQMLLPINDRDIFLPAGIYVRAEF